MDVSFRFAFWFLLALAIPTILVTIPLYLRHSVYSEARSAVVSSDFRVMDEKVSTVWCDGLSLRMNTTFNAYLLPERPRFENATRTYFTTKHFGLKLGEREYWGFFLPKGSTISVSSCARYDGAKIIVVKGKRHMNRCVRPGYVDSDEAESNESSDEDEEVSSFSSSEEATDELNCLHTLFNQTLTPTITCTHNSWSPKDVLVYTTPHTDYYYLVFLNTNPLVMNDIFAKLVLNKVVYDVKNYLKKCFNATSCLLPFSFSSDEHVVLEVPDRSLWVADIVQTTCEPRTVLYFPFYLGVPVSILIFAFRGRH